jgi:hypothetical protein
MDQFLAIEIRNRVVDLGSETIAVRVQRTTEARVDAQQATAQQATDQQVIGQPVIGQRALVAVQLEIDLRVLDLGIHARVVVAVVLTPAATTARAIANPMIATQTETIQHRSLA